MSEPDQMVNFSLAEGDPNPAEPRMVIWSTLLCLELQIDQHEACYNEHGVVSWNLLKHMVRLAKRHACEEGGAVIAAERETDQWRTLADEANAKLRETEQELQRLRRVHMESQSEELTEARTTIADLQKQLDAALASLTRERLDAEERGREMETLRAFVGKVRLAMWPEDIKYALAELDAGTIEPTPVAERQWFRTVVQIDGCVGRTTDGITHLETAAVWAAGQSADWRQCVSRTSGQIPDWVWKSMPLHMSYYAEVTFNRQTNMLDFRNWELRPQPTPVAETLDAEGGA